MLLFPTIQTLQGNGDPLGLEGEELRFNIELTDILVKPYCCITLNILHDLLHKKFTYCQLMLESDQNVAVFLLKE